MVSGRLRSLDLDRFFDACDRVFEGKPSPPAPDASTLTDEFQMLTQGLVCSLTASKHFVALMCICETSRPDFPA